MSANQIRRTIWGEHKGSYKTAWYLCHRIRAAMKEVDKPMLDGTVEMDETYVGGRARGRGKGFHKDTKECVIGIRERGGDLRFFHAEDAKSGTLANDIKEAAALLEVAGQQSRLSSGHDRSWNPWQKA